MAVCSIAFAVAAFVVQQEANRPIGEGDLFVAETAVIAEMVAADEPIDDAVRRARDAHDAEAVSTVGPDGTVTASSSETLVGSAVTGTLAFGHFDDRLVAIASPQALPVEIDGVEVWAAGDTLYAVVRPSGDGTSVLVHYDVSSLLAKRIQAAGVSGPAVALAVGALIAFLGVGFILLGRERAVRRYREANQEAELAKAHSRELEAQNAELDRARAAAERALALAEEKHRIRSEFVLMINHELRTPLTSVTTGARLLEDDHLDDTDRAMILEGMVADSERLESIIDHVLAVARIENQGIESPIVRIPASDLVDELAGALPRGVVVEVVGDLAGIEVATDRQTLSQLLASLADNALTHGAEAVSLVVATTSPTAPDLSFGQEPGQGLHLAIVDDGPGIDEDFLPRAFEKFEKRGFASGTGLGLYLARLMAEAIGASIAVRSGPDGTAMSVSVPATTVELPESVPV